MFNAKGFSNILQKITDTYTSISDFSDKSEVNRTYLSKYINMKLENPPSPKVLMKIANNSNDITTYEELMGICGFIIKKENADFTAIQNAKKTLNYNNMIKKLSLNTKEESIVNKINSTFDIYNKEDTIENSERKSLELLDTFNTSGCDVSKIKEATKAYIISQCTQIVVNEIYKIAAEIDTKYNCLDALNKLDVLSKDIKLENKPLQYYMCPVYGQISAGQPNWAEENIEGRIPIDTNLMDIVNPEEHFFLRVNGESMNKVIKNGAFALIHKQDTVENGEIAVVLVNGYDATLKKFTKQGDLIILEPQSNDETFKTQVYDKATSIQILGKYVGKMEMNV